MAEVAGINEVIDSVIESRNGAKIRSEIGAKRGEEMRETGIICAESNNDELLVMIEDTMDPSTSKQPLGATMEIGIVA